VWDVIRHKDWASVGGGGGRLWNVDRFYRTMGTANGGGVGGSLPIGIGGALAHRQQGRLCVRFQADGDMMYVNSALWTATHHRIPMLFVMHNNRAYHQEVMHLQRMANRRQRGMELAHGGLPGSTLSDPDIDFAQLARSMGAYAEGPIANPKDVRPALLRAVERVEKGEVALLDTRTQAR
jgi:acetolactate synthase-1/2/3 large subunit